MFLRTNFRKGTEHASITRPCHQHRCQLQMGDTLLNKYESIMPRTSLLATFRLIPIFRAECFGASSLCSGVSVCKNFSFRPLPTPSIARRSSPHLSAVISTQEGYQTHNLKVAGSNPSPAPNLKRLPFAGGVLFRKFAHRIVSGVDPIAPLPPLRQNPHRPCMHPCSNQLTPHNRT